MLFVNALKTVCDFLLFFSFASLFSVYNNSLLLLCSVILLAFIASLILQKAKGSLITRILCSLLPLLGLFAAQNRTQVIVTLIGIAFNAVCFMTNMSAIYYEDYKYWFGIPAVFAAVLFVICFSYWPLRQISTVCAILYLFLGIFVLRCKRIGGSAGYKLKLVNFAGLSGSLLFGISSSLFVFVLLRFFQKVVGIILTPLAILLSLIAYVFGELGRFLIPKLQEEEELPVVEEEVKEIVSTEIEAGKIETVDTTGYDKLEIVLHIVLIVLIAAVIIYLIYLFYKLIHKARMEESDSIGEIEEGEIEHSFLGIKRRKKKTDKALFSNNEKIRQIYKDYLLYISLYGVQIDRNTTSEEITRSASDFVSPDKAKELRELYIRARYHDDQELSKEDVKLAKALLTEMREELEQGKTVTT